MSEVTGGITKASRSCEFVPPLFGCSARSTSVFQQDAFSLLHVRSNIFETCYVSVTGNWIEPASETFLELSYCNLHDDDRELHDQQTVTTRNRFLVYRFLTVGADPSLFARLCNSLSVHAYCRPRDCTPTTKVQARGRQYEETFFQARSATFRHPNFLDYCWARSASHVAYCQYA